MATYRVDNFGGIGSRLVRGVSKLDAKRQYAQITGNLHLLNEDILHDEWLWDVEEIG